MPRPPIPESVRQRIIELYRAGELTRYEIAQAVQDEHPDATINTVKFVVEQWRESTGEAGRLQQAIDRNAAIIDHYLEVWYDSVDW